MQTSNTVHKFIIHIFMALLNFYEFSETNNSKRAYNTYMYSVPILLIMINTK